MKQLLEHIMRRHDIPNYNKLSQTLIVSHATVKRWLSGTDKPDISNCFKLSKLSGCPIDYVISICHNISEV